MIRFTECKSLTPRETERLFEQRERARLAQQAREDRALRRWRVITGLLIAAMFAWTAPAWIEMIGSALP